MLRHDPIPGNRWDLLTSAPPEPQISVIITHYNQERQLQRTCRALHRQTLLPLEVIVGDDGSSSPPTLAPTEIPVRVVSQRDLGFRAAAARNLGVRSAKGEVLVFLDADTSPEPDFLRQLTRKVALCRDVVAVGRRRHALFDAVDPEAEITDGAGIVGLMELEEPAWLRDGYAASGNLLDADGRSFRYIISAVMACRRTLYDEVGGFDERFVGYGGEDWDFAYRAWNAGGILVHEPSAVAWHDGPDWAARRAAGATHDRQSLHLAALIPEPSTRGAPLPRHLPDVLVDIAPGLDLGSTVRCIHSVLRQNFADLQIRLRAPNDSAISELYGEAVRSSAWDMDQLRRARARLTVMAPLPPGALRAAMDTLTDRDVGLINLRTSGEPAATLTSTRACGRARRWADQLTFDHVIENHFGRRDLDVGPAPTPGRDLAQFFAAWG